MHIYFSGIGGAGIGPLAQIALAAGYDVSGSDKRDSVYISYLKKHGLQNIHIGQTRQAIAAVHDKNPIDWFVYTSALPLENPDAPELKFCEEQDIKTSKRDELLNQILNDKNQKLIAVAGTHGKTTTTAMIVWLFKQLGEPISYILPAKTSFAELGEFDSKSKYFVYECDEFDRNFLAFEPSVSVITGVSWDHHEIFPTREDYQEAFKDFIGQSGWTLLWDHDADYLGFKWGKRIQPAEVQILSSEDPELTKINLLGKYNRDDAWLAVRAFEDGVDHPTRVREELIKIINQFPGLSRRMEEIVPNLYSDYAHTPEKIRGAMSVATEMAAENGQDVVVVYEPLTNRRQLHMIDDYQDCFAGASHIYWLPSYLAREDPKDRIIPPSELISHLADPTIAEPAERDTKLKTTIQKHLDAGDMVVGLAGGGGDSLDDWLRAEFSS